MLTGLCLLALLAPQRGSAAPKTAAETIRLAPVRQVTAGYLRMNDPGFVARVLDNADRPGGRSLAQSVLPNDYLKQRSQALAKFRPFLDNLKLGQKLSEEKPKEAVKSQEPISLGKKPGETSESDGKKGTPIVLKGTTEHTIDLGTVALDETGKAGVSAMFRDFSYNFQDDVTVEDAPSAIDAVKLIAYTGEVQNGEPQATTYAAPLVGKKFKLIGGQEYAVELRLSPKKLGSFTETIKIHENGTRVLTVKGTVVPKSGNLSSWVEANDLYLIPGTKKSGVLHVTVSGNAPTTVYLSGTGLAGTSISGTSRSAKANDQLDIPFTVSAAAGAANGEGIATLKVTAYDGKSSSTAKASMKVETLWTIWEGFKSSKGSSKVVGTFKYSSAGDWDYTLFGTTSAKALSDYTRVGVTIDTPLPNGKHLGALLGGWLAAKLAPGPSSVTWTASGHDSRLVGNQFVNSFLTASMFVDDDPLQGNATAQRQYWESSKNVAYLTGG